MSRLRKWIRVESVEINTTDCPIRLTDERGMSKILGVEGFGWQLVEALLSKQPWLEHMFCEGTPTYAVLERILAAPESVVDALPGHSLPPIL